jgi:hypothetical protein
VVIAIISTLISSVALAGVAISLLLQARQVRITQLQVSRAAQLELIKMALDNPTMASAAVGISNPDSYAKYVFLNWQFKHFELGYEIKTMSAENVRQSVAQLFENETPREWWSLARQSYEEGPVSRRGKQFFAIVDGEFRRLTESPSSTSDP